MEDTYIDIGRWEERLEKGLARLRADPEISDRNKEIILRYVRDARLGKTLHGRAKKKVGAARALTNVVHLTTFLHQVQRELDAVSQEDMELFIEALESGNIRSRRQVSAGGGRMVVRDHALSPGYQVDLKLTLRKFYKWLLGHGKQYPPLVEWLDTARRPNEIPALTQSEVQRMLDHARSIWHRVVIQILFDGGFRLSEFLNIRLRHVVLRSFDPRDPTRRCFFVRVPFSKTMPRTVALPMEESTKWLSLWLGKHPGKPRIGADGQLEAEDLAQQLFPCEPASVSYLLARHGREVLAKRVYPHLMRHSSATYWCNKLPYFKFCKRFGWAMTSKMPHRYIDREGIDEADVARIYHDAVLSRLDAENRVLKVGMALKAEDRILRPGVASEEPVSPLATVSDGQASLLRFRR